MSTTLPDAEGAELAAPALHALPLGAIRPQGWLERQLRIQADGQTGHLDEIWPDVGPDSAWLGGNGEDWERGPYYLDGLLPLAHLLGDEALLAKANRWVEAFLASQREDGQFGPPTNDDWWPRMVALKVLVQHAEATGDERVAGFMARYFRYQLAELPGKPLKGWGQARGADNVLSILWLYDRTGEAWLLDLARLLVSQTIDWGGYLTRELISHRATAFDHRVHGPNVAMGLKAPAVRHRLEGGEAQRRLTEDALENLERLHGLANGGFSGDEWLAGREPHQGVETCHVVEYMFTLAQIARTFGDRRYGDELELTAFNALPAATSADMKAHQYHQQPNQVLATVAQRHWTKGGDDANLFGFEPSFGCCTANMHQGWPKFVQALWAATPDGGLAAVAYAPCRVATTVAGEVPLELDVRTEYPFEERVEIVLSLDAPAAFPLRLRVPEWCTAPRVAVGGESQPAVPDEDGFLRLEQEWKPGDTITLELPMELRTVPRDRRAVSVRLGPLILVLSPGEVWRRMPDTPAFGDWEVTPRRAWNFGFDVRPGEPLAEARIERRPVGDVPFALESAPVRVHTFASRVPSWRLEDNSAGPVPEGPVPTGQPLDPVALVPYGSARLRITEFPTVPEPPSRDVYTG